MKNHFLCKLESHTEQSTGPENQGDLGNGHGKNSKHTTGQTPPQRRLGHPAAWRSVAHLPSGPTNTHCAPSYLLRLQVPPPLQARQTERGDCIPARTEPLFHIPGLSEKLSTPCMGSS